MDSFRTEVKITDCRQRLDYTTPIMMCGSCFAENIGRLLLRYKFPALVNPFGIVFHPLPLACQFDRMLNNRLYTASELHQRDDLWFSFDHHGVFSHPDANVCLQNINSSLTQGREQLLQATHIFITFGTAWAYQHLDSDKIVANCHHEPTSSFKRLRSTADDIVGAWNKIISQILEVNHGVRIVFSVSPVRHLRDGAHENQISKATLLIAVEQLCSLPQCSYFPAYELLLDDLRDYRFYADDMVHPSDTAIRYVWQRFCDAYIAESADATMRSVDDIVKATAHKPIHQSKRSYDFAMQYLKKIDDLEKRLSVTFEEEKAVFKASVSQTLGQDTIEPSTR